MSPYASIAFHPLDGIMQASPYVIMLFVVPMHFLTSLVMLFFTGIWAMNIHVSPWLIERRSRPIFLPHDASFTLRTT
jgi:sterol desaturase/sphingolipid hydroxylase (fatty acid hydroxylase superfamily)